MLVTRRGRRADHTNSALRLRVLKSNLDFLVAFRSENLFECLLARKTIRAQALRNRYVAADRPGAVMVRVQNTDLFVANDGLQLVELLLSRSDSRIAWPWRDRSAS